jgi:hypothetical protein
LLCWQTKAKYIKFSGFFAKFLTLLKIQITYNLNHFNANYLYFAANSLNLLIH